MSKIILTGGCGFIGAHVDELLAAVDCDVRILDRNITPIVYAAECRRIDVLDISPPDLEGADTIIHLAAEADISGNWQSPTNRSRCYRDNINATIELLEAASNVPTIKRFVLASSGSVYGNYSKQFGIRATETAPTRATSPYAASKLSGEALVDAYGHKFGWDVYVARLASCVGDGYTHGHIADFVHQMKATGKIHALDNGKQLKSYVHVVDAAETLIAMAQGAIPAGVYNVTSHELWSWRYTLSAMGLEDSTCETREAGWVGDPVSLSLDDYKLSQFRKSTLSVRAGVIQALESLGWHSGSAYRDMAVTA